MRALLLLASACSFNASTLAGSSSSPGPASSSQAVEPPTAPPSDEPIPPGAVRIGGRVDTGEYYFPVPERPVDPWAGVSQGKPVTFTLDGFRWLTSPEEIACTAARDHCLPAATWMWMAEATLEHDYKVAKPFLFTQEGPKRPHNQHPVPPEAFVAFRTVPVTKATLVVGARVFAIPSKPIPDDPWADWHVGDVLRVEWDMGFVYLSSAPQQPYFISAVRRPVLRWDATAGVQILDGKPRESLAVQARDVILPL